MSGTPAGREAKSVHSRTPPRARADRAPGTSGPTAQPVTEPGPRSLTAAADGSTAAPVARLVDK